MCLASFSRSTRRLLEASNAQTTRVLPRSSRLSSSMATRSTAPSTPPTCSAPAPLIETVRAIVIAEGMAISPGLATLPDTNMAVGMSPSALAVTAGGAAPSLAIMPNSRALEPIEFTTAGKSDWSRSWIWVWSNEGIAVSRTWLVISRLSSAWAAIPTMPRTARITAWTATLTPKAGRSRGRLAPSRLVSPGNRSPSLWRNFKPTVRPSSGRVRPSPPEGAERPKESLTPSISLALAGASGNARPVESTFLASSVSAPDARPVACSHPRIEPSTRVLGSGLPEKDS